PCRSGSGGRIHFDTYAFDRDLAATTGTTEFRRARLTLSGKAFGWDYKMEQDFGAGTNLEGLRDLYIAKSALGGKFTIGHFKPYRSMEELTSSNEILMMERPFASATGLFSNRQFQQGVGYQRSGDNYSAGFTAFNLRSAASSRTEGVGASGRVTYAPINNDNNTLHFGGWASLEDANQGSADLAVTANYAGRRGPSQNIGTVTGLSGDKLTAYGLEAAGAFGPLFFQGEYVNATLEKPLGDQDVMTYYVQGSWMLNGGHKVYKSATGVFGSPKVTDKHLWELTARYDYIENKDLLDREVSSWILGMNYYVNSNLRFMFNYTKGDNEFTGDETAQYALRTQFSF
ncbi:MAG: porin, partial [Burkholderiales bacterium]